MSYPQGPGQHGESPYPQYPGGPPQPGAAQYPQPPYPPTPAYPPQYAQPQAQPQAQPPYPGQYHPQAVPAKEVNPYARQAIILGPIVCAISIVALFFGYYATGILALYALYASIRGLITAFGLRTHAGLISSIFGLFFSLLSFLVTLLALGVFNSLLTPLLGG